MSLLDVIDISSSDDEEAKKDDVKYVKFILPLSCNNDIANGDIANNQSVCKAIVVKQELEEIGRSNSGSCVTEQGTSTSNFSSPVPLCRQFWKSGDYQVGQVLDTVSRDGRNRLRINPKFLHSNATSHKWAFGAVAELLDNAIDEVHNGATFVRIDKFTNPRNRNPALLIQDDGGGMDPESLRRCMSFGFSDKQSECFIGQYGNGFKTSTMRLGADVIVFSRCKKKLLAESVGLLSYTFLRQTGCDDIVVPTFDDIGDHGTKIIIFNLWFNDDGAMELDFDCDAKDILISGGRKTVQKNTTAKTLTQMHVASHLHYSLRAYASVLYLHMPENFRIVLRGEVVEPHNIANDLIYRECVLYKPQVGGNTEAAIVTTIGFLKGAPEVEIQGFNVYHKNRLILPFWKVANNSYGKGRGVVGILEANFIKPTHDKQDFEKSTIYQKLENRLKEMTYEYWDLHCHLVGYTNKKRPAAASVCHINDVALASSLQLPAFDSSANGKVTPAAARASTNLTAVHLNNCKTGSLTKQPVKRKNEIDDAATEASKRRAMPNVHELENDLRMQLEHTGAQKTTNEIKTMILENKKLHEQCLECEVTKKQLILKEEKLRNELQDAHKLYKKLVLELKLMELKMEKL
ncbi:protein MICRORCHIDIA 6-like isoform X2 [Typha latifolia]|uniref:protein MICRORCHIDIA 6-like isoform X2 n=1 Tax=Typha latifolia TaxID=4733 RepID=UPI003C2B48F9